MERPECTPANSADERCLLLREGSSTKAGGRKAWRELWISSRDALLKGTDRSKFLRVSDDHAGG